MAKIEEVIWQGQVPKGRLLGLYNTKTLLTRSLFLHSWVIYKQFLGLLCQGIQLLVSEPWPPRTLCQKVLGRKAHKTKSSNRQHS